MAQVITTKFLGPTDTKGSRVSVKSWIKNKMVAWDYSLNAEENHAVAVGKLLQELNKERASKGWGDFEWQIVGGGSMPDGGGYGFVVDLTAANL